MATTLSSALPSAAAIQAAKDRLDAWTVEVVNWHFDPEHGTPFWINYARKLGWDPRKEIHKYEDLDKLGPFQDDWLRGGPVRRWVPKALAHKPVYVFETGGSTGVPKSRIVIDDFRIDYEEFSKTLPDQYFPKGADWLMLGPSGPRRLRLAVEHLAQHRGGICFCIDLDPRWVIKLLKAGKPDEAERYKNHCIDQALTILKANEIKCMFATPKLLEALCEKIDLRKYGITGVFCGGTEMTPQFHRFAVEELLGPDIYFAPTYGNTLMGLATHKLPFDPADNWAIIYHPPSPRAMIEVVDFHDPGKVVGYGETGRVRLTTLTKEFFVPRFLERDECEREKPCAAYPWDGVRNVRPFRGFGTTVVEGVY